MPYETAGALARAIISKFDLQATLDGSLVQFLTAYRGKSAGQWERLFRAIGCDLDAEGRVTGFSSVTDPLPDVHRDLLPEKYRCAECVRLRAEAKALRDKVEASEALVRQLCGVLGIEIPS